MATQKLTRTAGSEKATRQARLAAPLTGRAPAWERAARPASGAARRGCLLVAALCLAAMPGCTTPRGVPAGSSLVTEATVKSSFQAPADGMLWIFRTAARGSRGQLHYSGPIAAGQVLVIDPSMNKATIDGQELELVLPGGDVWYQAYFRPDRSVRRVLADRPAGGRVAPNYQEMEPGQTDPTRASPPNNESPGNTE